MSVANKRRGATFELDLLKFFRREGYDAERLRLSGKHDEGDIVVRIGALPYVIEAKNVQKIDLASFVTQAQTEADNYSKARGIMRPGYAAIIKRRKHPIEQSYVVVPLKEWLEQIDSGGAG